MYWLESGKPIQRRSLPAWWNRWSWRTGSLEKSYSLRAIGFPSFLP